MTSDEPQVCITVTAALPENSLCQASRIHSTNTRPASFLVTALCVWGMETVPSRYVEAHKPLHMLFHDPKEKRGTMPDTASVAFALLKIGF